MTGSSGGIGGGGGVHVAGGNDLDYVVGKGVAGGPVPTAILASNERRCVVSAATVTADTATVAVMAADARVAAAAMQQWLCRTVCTTVSRIEMQPANLDTGFWWI